MFVELIYDKRNMAGVPNANELILAELTKRVHGTFPDAEVKVNAQQHQHGCKQSTESDIVRDSGRDV